MTGLTPVSVRSSSRLMINLIAKQTFCLQKCLEISHPMRRRRWPRTWPKILDLRQVGIPLLRGLVHSEHATTGSSKRPSKEPTGQFDGYCRGSGDILTGLILAREDGEKVAPKRQQAAAEQSLSAGPSSDTTGSKPARTPTSSEKGGSSGKK